VKPGCQGSASDRLLAADLLAPLGYTPGGRALQGLVAVSLHPGGEWRTGQAFPDRLGAVPLCRRGRIGLRAFCAAVSGTATMGTRWEGAL